MNIKNFLFLSILIISIALPKSLLAEQVHYLDFKLILNKSTAGKKAQDYLKNKLNKGIEEIKKKENKILEEEKKLIQQKKIISPEEYKKKISDLRKTVSTIQKERNKLLETVARERAKAKNELLKNLNPIIENYMSSNNIKMIIDKKNLIKADKSLDITKIVIDLLNQKVKSVKFN